MKKILFYISVTFLTTSVSHSKQCSEVFTLQTTLAQSLQGLTVQVVHSPQVKVTVKFGALTPTNFRSTQNHNKRVLARQNFARENGLREIDHDFLNSLINEADIKYYSRKGNNILRHSKFYTNHAGDILILKEGLEGIMVFFVRKITDSVGIQYLQQLGLRGAYGVQDYVPDSIGIYRYRAQNFFKLLKKEDAGAWNPMELNGGQFARVEALVTRQGYFVVSQTEVFNMNIYTSVFDSYQTFFGPYFRALGTMNLVELGPEYLKDNTHH